MEKEEDEEEVEAEEKKEDEEAIIGGPTPSIDFNLKKFKSKLCCCCYCCSAGTDHHRQNSGSGGDGHHRTGQPSATALRPGGQNNGQSKAACHLATTTTTTTTTATADSSATEAAPIRPKSGNRAAGDCTAAEEVSAGGSCGNSGSNERQQTATNRVQQNELQQQSENRVAGSRQSSEKETALGLKYANTTASSTPISPGTESSKWLLGCRKGPENNKSSSSNNNNITSKYNRSNSESATYPSLPVVAANLPSHRKSFEMKSIWNYIRNQSSTSTVGSSTSTSPQKQQQSQQSDNGNNNNNNNNGNNGNTATTSSNTNISNFSRFSNIIRGHYGSGSHVQPYSSSTRGNSIPESVLLGLLPPVADLTQGGSAGGGGRGHNSRQRNSAPTIIQKDKTEKTWERMLKMKSNEKKEKRKTARLMLKSWVTPSSSSSGRQGAMMAANAAAADEPITTVVEHSVSHHGGRRLSQIDKYIRANVVVIIDKVSPTTNGHHIDDHLSMLNGDEGGDHDGRTAGDLYDQSITSEDNFTSCRSCTAQDQTASYGCHCSSANTTARTTSTINETNDNSPERLEHPQLPANMSSGFTAVSHSASNNSSVAMASSKRAGMAEHNGTVGSVGSSGSFSRDNSGETISGSDSTADQSHQTQQQHYSSTHQHPHQHQHPKHHYPRSASEHSAASQQTPTDRPGSTGERGGINDDFEGDDDVIGEGGGSCPNWRRNNKPPESCSSYSSLNNDEESRCESLHSQDEDGGSQAFDLPSQFAAGRSGGGPGGYNYPRKYSLTVPGEPRHMRLLHRRESGSRSPLNSSCGGLSPSELSTPSPSCSNSINDDQSSCSSGALNAASISIELNRKCAVSVDSLLLKTSSSRARAAKEEKKKSLMSRDPDLQLDSLVKGLRGLQMSSSGSMGGAGDGGDNGGRKGSGNVITPTSAEVHLGASSKEDVIEEDGSSVGDKDMPDLSKMPKRRKDSMTALIASYLLPDSLCQRFGSSLSSDRIHQSSANAHTSRSISPRSIFSSKPKSSSANDTRRATEKSEKVRSQAGTSSTSNPAGQAAPPTRNRKGSIAQITSASATRFVRLLRRTHSAGCSKDVPAYAQFLKEEKTSARKKRKERKQRGRKQAPALEDMKQRLRFLRRRHTDSSLHASTVRPPRNEVEKWSKSFRDLMANRYGCALFRAFLSREYSEENIEFWIACEEYRKARSSKLHHKARKIFDRFLAVCAPKEVNLDPQLRADILQTLSTPHKTTFDEAQRRIQSLLESDSYLRFLTSDIYTQLLNSEQERKKDEAEEAAASMAESEMLESDEARTPTPSTSRLGGRTRQPLSSSSNLASSPFPEDDC